jgi:RimJ/RimL family protein N-acetyltransferase
MERMPYHPGLDLATSVVAVNTTREVVTTDWRDGIAPMIGLGVTLRELQLSDAQSLFTMLTTEEVSRFISPPPSTIEGFERFIAWTHRERAAGNYVCLAVVPDGYDTAIGIFQVRQLEPGFKTAEWGFAIGSAFWGTGVFPAAAALVLQLTFETLRVHRLEARCSVQNGRGSGALRKIGAVQEGVLRRSFVKDGTWHDQLLYSIIDTDWRAGQRAATTAVRMN